ncbi:hypothetical protein TKWG_20845 [Advenella kashmirensis WT001]|uniref:Uncharacterized protein n=1 Tax=Advenella kashmirensis (strain DSM 17095 / LMG 22695 / WT001) TaxID=1036672 RepID=I3UFU8_ADVKW|nr:hypothetical protein TKWG_20845 [Advenella kashmirensis WT001]
MNDLTSETTFADAPSIIDPGLDPGHPRHASNPTAAALSLLDLHYEAFYDVEPFASQTGHPVPMDTRGWSQILASVLSGINGLARQKGADLADGSDVKGANTWKAIDTPRFNGVIKAGTKALTSDKIESLDVMPHLYLVLWDQTIRDTARCRIWVVRPQHDVLFRGICTNWYDKRTADEISSTNFQLHPPRRNDSNVIRNSCGNLEYPLYFCADVPTAKANVTA